MEYKLENMTEKTEGAEQTEYEENVEHVVVDIDINIEDDIDPKKATKYLEKLFILGDKFGELLHKEGLTIGEALFIIYILEKGALDTMEIDDPDDIYHALIDDNKSRIDMIANIIIKHSVEKDKKEKDEQKN